MTKSPVHCFVASEELCHPVCLVTPVLYQCEISRMKMAIKLCKETQTKDTILRLNKSKVGLKDVEAAAELVVTKMKSSDKSRDAKYVIVKELMKHTLKDIMKCIKSTKEELNVSNVNLSKVVRKGTLVRKEFMKLVDNEIGISWKKLKEKNKKKLTGMFTKTK